MNLSKEDRKALINYIIEHHPVYKNHVKLETQQLIIAELKTKSNEIVTDLFYQAGGKELYSS